MYIKFKVKESENSLEVHSEMNTKLFGLGFKLEGNLTSRDIEYLNRLTRAAILTYFTEGREEVEAMLAAYSDSGLTN